MKYKVKSKVWLWGGGEKGSWHFVTIPPDTSEKILKKYKEFKRGWGSLPVKISFPPFKKGEEKVVLETSIFPNKNESNYFTYLLPIKKKVRNELGIQNGDVVDFVLEVKI